MAKTHDRKRTANWRTTRHRPRHRNVSSNDPNSAQPNANNSGGSNSRFSQPITINTVSTQPNTVNIGTSSIKLAQPSTVTSGGSGTNNTNPNTSGPKSNSVKYIDSSTNNSDYHPTPLPGGYPKPQLLDAPSAGRDAWKRVTGIYEANQGGIGEF